ncbi:MAG: N-6 DNA methylase [Chloroflexia bacterium]|nr:N-6 DNA methylase [Chloroflexia bacterium]
MQKGKIKTGRGKTYSCKVPYLIQYHINQKFDLVVGNPPFKSAKTGSIEPEASIYCKEQGFAQEMVLPFLHRATFFCNKEGTVSIVSTSKILFNKSGGYNKFREFLFQKNYVDAVFNFSALRKPKKGQGKSIFAHAVGPSCVLFYRKKPSVQVNPNITYVCPKPTERDRYSDSLVLDELDYFFLPRNECEKPDSIIWKVGMWGIDYDFQLIKKMISGRLLKDYLTKENGWFYGGGLKFLTPTKDKEYINNEINLYPIIEAKHISRYFTDESKLKHINETLTDKNIEFYLNYYNVSTSNDLPVINLFRHEGFVKGYSSPHVLIKEGQSDKKFCASFFNFDCCFKDTITGITYNKQGLNEKALSAKTNLLKAITAYLNSKFASYYLFLSSVSWGIERERVTAKDTFELPALPFEMEEEKVNKLSQKLMKYLKSLQKISGMKQ